MRESARVEREISSTVLIVSPNLALDHILQLPFIALDEVQTAAGELLSAGGKGINVARSLRVLGINSTVHTVVGGAIGELVEKMATAEGIAIAAMRLAVNTRVAAILVDTEAKTSTVINPPGPRMTTNDWNTFMAGVSEAITYQQPRFVLCTGSLPTGVPETAYAEILQHARASGAFTMLDTSGSVLRAALTARPDLVKVNREEAAELFAADNDAQEAGSDRELVSYLLTLGATRAVLTLGPYGALAREGIEQVRVRTQPVHPANATGAGDAFLAALCRAYAAGQGLGEALRHSVALAAASVESLQPGYFKVSRLNELLATVTSESE